MRVLNSETRLSKLCLIELKSQQHADKVLDAKFDDKHSARLFLNKDGEIIAVRIKCKIS